MAGKTQKLGQLFIKTTFLTLFVVMLIAAIHPDVRSGVRGSFLKDYRTIVSTARGHLQDDARQFTVLKIKTRDALFVEIYGPNKSGINGLIQKIQLADVRDAYFNFNGHASNLAIDDIDGDKKPEILVPSIDKDMIGHLNVFRLNADSNEVERVVR